MRLVVDASVALKWFFRDRDDEPDAAVAVDILERFVAGELSLRAPCHFAIELCAVLARVAPATMRENLADLLDLAIPVRDDAIVLARGMRLASELDHHPFDTLCHALAIEEETVLVTADRRYWRKGRDRGAIVMLEDWTPG